MTNHKTWCLILLVSVSFVGISATMLASKQQQNKIQCDGGAPVPPFPKLNLVADGGAPVPPFPTNNLTLVADGGAPVPPFPTINGDGTSAEQLLKTIAG